ncbi:hypothetical protein Lal_00027490 [Lupinus albus]|uniref:RING-type E3 ubiquitin transferase n=1 Tax=Lupinus albus TaxID=3870 RepID=A0A6A4QHD6_LUPAL|nr:putative transcription factor C2H2 family [Lupinus albus]KAF1873452.1 hypothetical protein Lal_00027490 [Lupinus albus]
MVSLSLLCLFLVILFHLHTITRGDIFEIMSCGEIDIQFPFCLKGANYKGGGCNYPHPNFQLSCDNHSRTILTLPHSGDLLVKRINYEEQIIQVNDPNVCLPKSFLQNLTLSISHPFIFYVTFYDLYNLVFVKCPSNLTDSISLPSISCLQETNSSSSTSSYFSFFGYYVNVSESPSLFYGCEVVSSSVVVPFPNMNSDIELIWERPISGDCDDRSQFCGFVVGSSLQVGCISDPNHTTGVSRSLKYGLSIGVGILALLCLIELSCFICMKFNTELPSSISIFTLQLQPRNLSQLLLKPNDNMCPICLSEYEPKEILRIIPECNHYFHALCIDEWLKMNVTCPLCRNAPYATYSDVASSYSSRTIDNPIPNHTLDIA